MNISEATLGAGLALLIATTTASAESQQNLGDFVVEALGNTLMSGNASAVPDYFSPA